jgi:CubicO group peptidase (beta-lactamase class C family)
MTRVVIAFSLAAISLIGTQAIAGFIDRIPENQRVLFWSTERRDAAFRAMEKVGPVRIVAAGPKASPLVAEKPLNLMPDIETFMNANRMAGLIVLQNGKIRAEHYGLGLKPDQRWSTFSVAKSITSTLVGAAIRDGHIKALSDPVTRYIPELSGSAYDGVTVQQLLTMTSGVKWSENYASPSSDVARFITQKPEPGMDVTVSYMRKLRREAPPGSKWVYKTGETNLAGVLVSKATGKTLAHYLSEKIWQPYGMERDAIWALGATDHEISGCCLSATLRDYARFGQFMLDGGMAGGRPVLPDGWIEQATRKQVGFGNKPNGYGYQWWTGKDDLYWGSGIFGQLLAVDPERKLVVVMLANWPKASGPSQFQAARNRLYASVKVAVDKESSDAAAGNTTGVDLK